MKLPFSLGIHPINWVGEDVLEHGDHYTSDDIMQQISELGFSGTEVSRKFPTDPIELKAALDKYNLQLTTQWKSVFFSDRSRHEEQLKEYQKHIDFLKQFGCKVISTAEARNSILNQDPTMPEDAREVRPLTDDEWEALADGLNKAGKLAQEAGMKLVYHHHAGTVVEQPLEIERLMSMTDPNYVHLLYDSGHGYYGGNDPIELLEKYYDRVGYIHLKDVRQDVLDAAHAQKYPIRESLRKGIFTVPGSGVLDFEPIFRYLLEKGYSDWALIEGEQDPSIYNPYEFAQKALEYIETIVSKIESDK
ncbi:myo-inosose-2 dehydratase [Lysinibacillus sp. NPDC098008]|uniref:myo-inosose-2 dehydratase n=1 Tax=Lysinibacillus sp. NPDC098008 TaxID=3364146 RepID=UPI00381B47F3